MESIRDLEEYLRELLDMSMPLSQKFVENLLDVWRQLHDKNYSVRFSECSRFLCYIESEIYMT